MEALNKELAFYGMALHRVMHMQDHPTPFVIRDQSGRDVLPIPLSLESAQIWAHGYAKGIARAIAYV